MHFDLNIIIHVNYVRKSLYFVHLTTFDSWAEIHQIFALVLKMENLRQQKSF